jgi:hypothetical protein
VRNCTAPARNGIYSDLTGRQESGTSRNAQEIRPMRTKPRSASSTVFALTLIGAGMIAATTMAMTTPTEAEMTVSVESEFNTASQFEITYADEICDG